MKENQSQSPPTSWCEGTLSKFLDTCERNAWATFANHREWFDLLEDIHDAFQKIAENLHDPSVGAPTVLLPRCHSAYLAAVRLAVAGQPPETYMVLRGCLEFALYGAYIGRDTDRSRQWLGLPIQPGRGSSFQMKAILAELAANCPDVATDARYLYGHCIDQGGHPNTPAVTWNMRTERSDEQTRITLQYLKAEGPSFHIAVKTAAQVGLVSLQLFERVFPERFQLLGVSDRLSGLASREAALSEYLLSEG